MDINNMNSIYVGKKKNKKRKGRKWGGWREGLQFCYIQKIKYTIWKILLSRLPSQTQLSFLYKLLLAI